MIRSKRKAPPSPARKRYVLNEQVGFLLRVAMQRHTTIFTARMIEELTQTQFAALAKLLEAGSCSQNHLGRLIYLDAATIKGVVDRLMKRGLVRSATDETDARRRLLTLSDAGRAFVEANFDAAHAVTRETLAPLAERERAMFVALLEKLK